VIIQGQERVALAKKNARADSLDRYVPLPDKIKNALEVAAGHARAMRAASRYLKNKISKLRLGIPKQIKLPQHFPYAVGSPVMFLLPSGLRVEHILCAHISKDLWYCHAGTPAQGELGHFPFHPRELVVQSLHDRWHPWQPQRHRLRGRCVRRGLVTAAMKRKCKFEEIVAHATWLAEAFRARQNHAPLNLDVATAAIDFTEEAFAGAARDPWNANVCAVWQICYGDTASPSAIGDVEPQHCMRSCSYRKYSGPPEGFAADLFPIGSCSSSK